MQLDDVVHSTTTGERLEEAMYRFVENISLSYITESLSLNVNCNKTSCTFCYFLTMISIF